jgi:hypothetical protein
MAAPVIDSTRCARLDIDPDDVGRGFGQVVLAVAELLRELLERQAIRRMDAGDLNAAQIERLGAALLHIKEQLAALREVLEPTLGGEIR